MRENDGITGTGEQGKTALNHLLADKQHEAGYAEIVRLLLAYNAKVGIVDCDGNTALSLSVLRGLNDMVSFLKQAGAKE